METVSTEPAGVRKGGTPVDLRDDTTVIAERTGILAALRATALPPRTTEFADVEIHRDDLLPILFVAVVTPQGRRGRAHPR